MENKLEKKYTKITKIHQGVDSEVWIVTDKDTGIKYIEKILYRTNLIFNKIKDIKTNNIPKIIYMIEDIDSNKTYIIEEFIEGTTLSKYITKKISEDEIKRIMLSLCDALVAIHDEEIVHQDIKPANIMYTPKKEIKLIDFDTAVDFGPNINTEHKKNGTEGFAAPEQYIYEKLIDERTDIYALGITISQLLGPNYKGYLNNIVEKCTEFNPDDRYNNVNDLIYAIKNKKITERRKKIYGKMHYEGLEKWLYYIFYFCALNTCIAIPGSIALLLTILLDNNNFIYFFILIYVIFILNSPYIIKTILEYVSSLEASLLYQNYGNEKKIYITIHFIISFFAYLGMILGPIQAIIIKSKINMMECNNLYLFVILVLVAGLISILLSTCECYKKYKKIS